VELIKLFFEQKQKDRHTHTPK